MPGNSTVYDMYGNSYSLSEFLSKDDRSIYSINPKTLKKTEDEIVFYKKLEKEESSCILKTCLGPIIANKNQHVYCMFDGDIFTKKVCDIQKNDCLLSPKTLFTKNSYEHNLFSNSFSFSDNIIRNKNSEYEIKLYKQEIGNIVFSNGTMSDDMFYLAGYLAGQLAKRLIKLSDFEYLNNDPLKKEDINEEINMVIQSKSMTYNISQILSETFRIEPAIHYIDKFYYVLQVNSSAVKEILFHIIFNIYKYDKKYIYNFFSGLNDCVGNVYMNDNTSAYIFLAIPSEIRSLRYIINRLLNSMGILSAKYVKEGIKIWSFSDICNFLQGIKISNSSIAKNFIYLFKMIDDGQIKKNRNIGFYLGKTLKKDLNVLQPEKKSIRLSPSMITKFTKNQFINYGNFGQLAHDMCLMYNPINHKDDLRIIDIFCSDVIGLRVQGIKDHKDQNMYQIQTLKNMPISVNNVFCATTLE